MSAAIPSSALPAAITTTTAAAAQTPPPSSPTSVSSPSSSLSSSSISIDATEQQNLSRPHHARTSVVTAAAATTNIIAHDEHDPQVKLEPGDHHGDDETFAPDDARAMSPRMSSEDLEKMSRDARRELSQHAKILHESLLEIFNRIDAVKQEHDKLDNNNKFLQKYIGDLMSTSKITATGASGRKKK